MKMFRMFKKDERGSALAEFVLVVPVFLMFFFWVFEIGILNGQIKAKCRI